MRREFAADDKRVVLVHLTSKGEGVIRKAFAKHEKNMEEVFTDFSEKERLEFARLLKKAGKSIEEIPK